MSRGLTPRERVLASEPRRRLPPAGRPVAAERGPRGRPRPLGFPTGCWQARFTPWQSSWVATKGSAPACPLRGGCDETDGAPPETRGGGAAGRPGRPLRARARRSPTRNTADLKAAAFPPASRGGPPPPRDSPPRSPRGTPAPSGAGRQASIWSQGTRPNSRVGSDRKAKHRGLYTASNARPLPRPAPLVTESQRRHASLRRRVCVGGAWKPLYVQDAINRPPRYPRRGVTTPGDRRC